MSIHPLINPAIDQGLLHHPCMPNRPRFPVLTGSLFGMQDEPVGRHSGHMTPRPARLILRRSARGWWPDGSPER